MSKEELIKRNKEIIQNHLEMRKRITEEFKLLDQLEKTNKNTDLIIDKDYYIMKSSIELAKIRILLAEMVLK